MGKAFPPYKQIRLADCLDGNLRHQNISLLVADYGSRLNGSLSPFQAWVALCSLGLFFCGPGCCFAGLTRNLDAGWDILVKIEAGFAGRVPEWTKGAGCKPVGNAFVGSNPTAPNSVWLRNYNKTGLDSSGLFSSRRRPEASYCIANPRGLSVSSSLPAEKPLALGPTSGFVRDPKL